MGRYNIKIKELTNSDIKKYPSIFKAIENIQSDNVSLPEFTLIPKVEWDKMVSHYLNPIEDLQTFKYEGNFYGPQFAWDTIWKKGTVQNLKIILKVIGIIMIFLWILADTPIIFS